MAATKGPGLPRRRIRKLGLSFVAPTKDSLTCKFAGSWQSVRPTTGSIWLRPIGRNVDEVRICSPKLEVLHLYVPTVAFARADGRLQSAAGTGTFHP